jgi:hypothetical protein
MVTGGVPAAGGAAILPAALLVAGRAGARAPFWAPGMALLSEAATFCAATFVAVRQPVPRAVATSVIG